MTCTVTKPSRCGIPQQLPCIPHEYIQALITRGLVGNAHAEVKLTGVPSAAQGLQISQIIYMRPLLQLPDTCAAAHTAEVYNAQFHA